VVALALLMSLAPVELSYVIFLGSEPPKSGPVSMMLLELEYCFPVFTFVRSLALVKLVSTAPFELSSNVIKDSPYRHLGPALTQTELHVISFFLPLFNVMVVLTAWSLVWNSLRSLIASSVMIEASGFLTSASTPINPPFDGNSLPPFSLA